MAAGSTKGNRGQPKFPTNEAPELGVDEEAVSNFASVVGTRRVGTTAERNALVAPEYFKGLLWGDTTVGEDYRATDSGWKKVTGLIRADRTSGTSSQGGDINVTFAPAFTSTCFSIVVTDSNTGGGIGPVPLKIVSRSATGAVVRVMQNEIAVSGFPTSFYYVAFGD